MNKELMRQARFGKHVEAVERGKCPFCGKVVFMGDFRNELSLKEFKISGLWQKCQDEFFGKD